MDCETFTGEAFMLSANSAVVNLINILRLERLTRYKNSERSNDERPKFFRCAIKFVIVNSECL